MTDSNGHEPTGGLEELQLDELDEELQEIARAKRLDALQGPFPALTALIDPSKRSDPNQ